MEVMIHVAIVLEIIAINMSVFYRNATPKYSLLKTCIVICLYTIFLIAGGLVLLKQLSFYGNGNGIFTMLGFLYMPIFKYLFKENYRDEFFIICYAWIYTLVVFSISVQFGYILGKYGRYLMWLLAQTIIFASTYRLMFKYVENVYVKLLDCQDKEIRKYLDQENFIWFATVFLINLNFIFKDVAILKIIVFVVIMINVVFSYLLLSEILKKGNRIGDLQNQIAKDLLTDIGSRIGFEYCLKQLSDNNSEFALIYMDLDNFKGINDRFGHLLGDCYLKEFASKLKELKSINVFRIAGDEFVLISNLDNYQNLVECIGSIDFELDGQVPFNGVSMGYALYPSEANDIEELIHLADSRMYQNKSVRER